MWSQLIRSNPIEKFKTSEFRRKFSLDERDLHIIQKQGMELILKQAVGIMTNRLMMRPENDGKQTPYYGHPVFKAMHATACCCRVCMEKWHHIPRNKQLNEGEIKYLASVIYKWLKDNMRPVEYSYSSG